MTLPTRKTENWKYTAGALARLDIGTPARQNVEVVGESSRVKHPFLASNLTSKVEQEVITFSRSENKTITFDAPTSRPSDVQIRRYQITAKKHSSAELTINYTTTEYLNVVFLIDVEEGANLRIKTTQALNAEACLIVHTVIKQGKDSAVKIVQQDQGGKLVRHDYQVKLQGKGAEFEARGLYWPKQDQHMDTHLLVEHIAPHCKSKQFYRGVVEDNGHAVFSTAVKVHEGAAHSVSSQLNNNLLLSPKAEVDTLPILEIYHDDVICNHGATVGQLDDEALFYLRSRGITLDEAKKLLLEAFVAEVL